MNQARNIINRQSITCSTLKFLITYFNSLVYDLLLHQNFGTVKRQTIRYIHQEGSPIIRKTTVESSFEFQGNSEPYSIDYSVECSFSDENSFGCQDDTDPYSLQQYGPCNTASFDSARNSKRNLIKAFELITSKPINSEYATPTTYQAYVRLGRVLRVCIPFVGDTQQCITCGNKINSGCRCVKHIFNYVQHVECTCRFGMLGFCVCDDFPEIFYDLDELREIQVGHISEIFPFLLQMSIEFSEGLGLSICYYTFDLKSSAFDCLLIAEFWSSFKPP